MILQDKDTGTMIEVMDIDSLISPTKDSIPARVQEGQEEQNPESYRKANLVFPSGESLPRCWLDANYRIAS